MYVFCTKLADSVIHKWEFEIETAAQLLAEEDEEEVEAVVCVACPFSVSTWLAGAKKSGSPLEIEGNNRLLFGASA